MPSVSCTKRTKLWNFKGRFPFTVAVLFCEGAFFPPLHIVSLCPGIKKQMLQVWFVKRQFSCNVNITAQTLRWWRHSFRRLIQSILLIWEPLNAVDLAPLLRIVLDHGGATWASLHFDAFITKILHGDLCTFRQGDLIRSQKVSTLAEQNQTRSHACFLRLSCQFIAYSDSLHF